MDGFCYLFHKFYCVQVLENIQSSLFFLKYDIRHFYSRAQLNVISTCSGTQLRNKALYNLNLSQMTSRGL